MTLPPGTRFGRYEITSQIGAGGMGEVYGATDNTLGRVVAIKVLPASVLTDPERVARFEREARALAALNHPNIATVHGLEESSGTHALVMELVDGVTLAERLTRSAALPTPGSSKGLGLPLDEALGIARQIALALKLAHEHGIVHRDLKPANIKIREDGTVKVLDFGLAKIMDRSAAELSMEDAPPSTITTPSMTKAGVILGTPAYMSPEQASGKPAHRGADIWAFGCLLFEILAGTRAFEGKDAPDTLARVLVTDPDWTLLPKDLPPPIRLVLSRCLEKDPHKRLADISAALLLIDELPSLTGLAADAESAARQLEHTIAQTRRDFVRNARWRITLTALAGLTLGALAMSFGGLREPSRLPFTVRTMIATTGEYGLERGGFDRDVAITPDGTRIVYRGRGQLFVRALDSLTPIPLPSPGNPQGVFMSPDGQWVGYFDANSALWKIGVSGGPGARLTSSTAQFPRGATWTDDDMIVYADATSAGLWMVPASGGEPKRLTSATDRGREHVAPEALPGDDAVLFTIGSPGTDPEVAVLERITGAYRTLLRGASGARYLTSGHLVYNNGSTLLAVPFDAERLEVTGEPVPLPDRPAITPGSGLDGAVSRNGTLAYVPGAASMLDERTLVWVDRQGREELLPAPPRTYQIVRLSPDGTHAAADIRDQDNDIWVWSFVSRTLSRLTAAPRNDMFPVWTNDSRRVIFLAPSDGAERSVLTWQLADGSTPAQALLSGFYRPYQISPDGSTLILADRDNLMSLDLRVTANGAPPTLASHDLRPLVATSFMEQNGEVSPDGKWLAYQSNEAGRDEVYVRPFPNVDAGRWQVSTDGGRAPLWAHSGQELFFVTPDGAVMGARLRLGSGWQNDAPTLVVQPGYFHAGEVHRTFDVSLDDERFLMIKQNANAAEALTSIVVVQNLNEELTRVAPVD